VPCGTHYRNNIVIMNWVLVALSALVVLLLAQNYSLRQRILDLESTTELCFVKSLLAKEQVIARGHAPEKGEATSPARAISLAKERLAATKAAAATKLAATIIADPKPKSARCTMIQLPDSLNHTLLSADHCIFTIDDYLTEEDIAALISLGEKLHRQHHGPQWASKVMFASEFLSDQYKTNALPIVLKLEQKIAALTQNKPHYGETPLMYSTMRPGALGRLFLRNIHHDHNLAPERTVTVLIYLSDANDKDGGHTIFPTIPSQNPNSNADIAAKLEKVFSKGYAQGERSMSPYSPDGGGPSDDSKPGGNWNPGAFHLIEKECMLSLTKQNNVMAVTPKKGMALVFPSVQLDGKTPDPLTWHAGCHATRGNLRRAVQKFKAKK